MNFGKCIVTGMVVVGNGAAARIALEAIVIRDAIDDPIVFWLVKVLAHPTGEMISDKSGTAPLLVATMRRPSIALRILG